MIVHPSIQLEIDRQRRHEMLARVERRRMAEAGDGAEATLTVARRLRDRATRLAVAIKTRSRRHLDVVTDCES